MEILKVMIIEDDQFTSKLVELIIIKHFPEMNVVARCGSVSEAIVLTRENEPDLIILDIQLEDGNAFDFLEQVKPLAFKVLFMSSYQAYLEEAIQFAAVDFVKKPFGESDLIMALDKALGAFSDSGYGSRLNVLFSNIESDPCSRSLVISTENGNRVILIGDLEYGESVPGGAIFYMNNGEILKTQYPLRRFEILLAATGFYRCHPRFLINTALVATVNTRENEILFKSGSSVPFEERRADIIISRCCQLNGVISEGYQEVKIDGTR